MVFYLKYRPSKLSELDNFTVSELIGKYLQRETVPHAFLFTGPRGTGKTSTARIIAKSINCENSNIKIEACGKCENCLSIASGNDLDILEIDAASNRGIDEIRELREKIKLTPLKLKYKVYIIDEVHMLTTEAFNALLKTLEEPPKHAIFILATTEIHKVPETIISRCTKIDFHKATDAEIINSLKRIVKGENLEVDSDALLKIAQTADGSFRDGAKILEEISLGKGKITLEKVLTAIGSVSVNLEKEFLENLNQKKAKELLIILDNLNKEGKNIRQFFLNILNQMEKLLIATYQEKNINWQRADLISVIKLFNRAFGELKQAVIPSIPFEIAIVEYVENLTDKKIEVNYEANKLVQNIPITSATIENKEVEPIVSKWTEILEAIKPFNHSIAGVLRSCRPVALDSKFLTIEAAYKFHAERISELKAREAIMEVIKKITGLNIGIKTEIKKR